MHIVAETAAKVFSDSDFPLQTATYEKLFRCRCVGRVCREYENQTDRGFDSAFIGQVYSAIVRRFDAELRAVPHVSYALAWLREPKSVFSEWLKDVIRAGLETADLTHFFAGHRVVSFHDTGFEQPFLVLSKILAIAPSECTLVCRSPATIAQAIQSSLNAIGYAGSAESEENHENRLAATAAARPATSMASVGSSPSGGNILNRNDGVRRAAASCSLPRAIRVKQPSDIKSG